ncbi:Oxidoreductase NAD-binding domain-containing protein 1 [Balamuthia mandrillaris]
MEQQTTTEKAQESRERKGHAELTAHVQREETQHRAVIEKIRQATPTVKTFLLRVVDAGSSFTFKPGQWLDCHLPGCEVVGGYSICSSLRQFQQEGTLLLAVKFSTHPPAFWMHRTAKEGDIIGMRVGGEFFLSLPHPTREEEAKAEAAEHPPLSGLLFIAGGMGINPLYSMLLQLFEPSQEARREVKALCLYSAKTEEELLFGEELRELAKHSHGQLRLHFFLTAPPSSSSSPSSLDASAETVVRITRGRRISQEDLQRALGEELTKRGVAAAERPLCFLCGPPSMTDTLVGLLQQETLFDPTPHLRFEKWW